jgi:hypothetical protein
MAPRPKRKSPAPAPVSKGWSSLRASPSGQGSSKGAAFGPPLLLARLAFSAVGIASAEKPVVVEASSGGFDFNAGFTPKALPKKACAPVVLNLGGKVQTKDGTQPPPLTEFVLEADKNIAIDVRGYPTCPVAGHQRGTSGSKTTLYVHAYLTQPITTAFLTTVKISRIHNGRFGLKLRGKPFSILSAKCPDGHLNAHGEAIFKDGTKAEAEVTRPCTGKE